MVSTSRSIFYRQRMRLVASLILAVAILLSLPTNGAATSISPSTPVTSAMLHDASSSPDSPGWTQDGHDAQRTGSTSEEPVGPWTFAWAWNGPDAAGGTRDHLYDASPEARTVVGGGYVFAPAGALGLYALDVSTGAPAWHITATSFNATPAYDPASNMLFAGGSDGNLYEVRADSGKIAARYAAGSPINKAVLIVGRFVYVVTESGQLHKVDIASMTASWTYSGGAQGSTPPSYSSSRDVLIYATADLFVHAVSNGSGEQRWRVKPSPNPAEFPFTFNRGWPVIAERHGIVLLRMQLSPDFLNDFPNPNGGNVYPDSNAAVRSYLEANPTHKNLFALDLDNGSEKFVPAVGYGSTEDFIDGRPFGVMGSQPVVKVWPDGTEVVYIHFRNGQGKPQDYRSDGNMGEMVLDDTTIPSMAAGDLRFVCMARVDPCGGVGYVNITDEQDPITMAGSTIFQAHWAASESVTITDRSSTLGLSYDNPIKTAKRPTVIRQQAACADFDPETHLTTCGLTMYQDGRYWDGPGYWVYWNAVAPPGSPQPNAYSAGFLPRYTYVANGMIVIEGNGGELFALRHSDAVTASASTP